MIVIQLNGEERTFETPPTLLELIRILELPAQSIAVAVNSEIIPRSEVPHRRLKTQDHVEIIRAAAGG